MSGRTGRLIVVALTAGMAMRLDRARRLTQRMAGSPLMVRTDDGVRLHVETDGPHDTALTVVFAHGLAARAAMFEPQWTALRGECRLVRYDQRGHGDSGWPGFRSATIDRLGRDLGQVIDELGGRGRVVVVGHSMGGMAVLGLARLRPDLFGTRIAGVALLSTRAAPLTAAEGDAGAALRVRAAPATAGTWWIWLVAPLVQAVHPFRSRIGRRMLRRRLFAGDPPESAARATADMWIRTRVAGMAAYLIGLAGYDARGALDPLSDIPVLVLAGADDSTIPARSARWLADRIDGPVRQLLMPGAGHMVTLTHAAVVNTALLHLLGEVRAGTDGRTTP